jgi:hypothetical protein
MGAEKGSGHDGHLRHILVLPHQVHKLPVKILFALQQVLVKNFSDSAEISSVPSYGYN